MGPKELIKYISDSSSLHSVNQIHGNKILDSEDCLSPSNPLGDGIVSSLNKSQSLWLYTADCIPILIADKSSGRTAVCHAGWKGLCKRIVSETIKKLESKGSKRKNLIITLGPSISGCNYEVKREVIVSILSTINCEINSEKIFSNEINRLVSILKNKNKNESLLDIRLVAFKQLTEEGIQEDCISISPFCTFKEDILFHSWRRDKVKNRQWSAILSK
tara:strand:+ start:14574 stop:15227 length:654 start_codon:yes stop_codon:yes gene_type:complete